MTARMSEGLQGGVEDYKAKWRTTKKCRVVKEDWRTKWRSGGLQGGVDDYKLE